VTTCPGTEPKRSLLVTLGKSETKAQRVLAEPAQQRGLPLPYVACTHSSRQQRWGAAETARGAKEPTTKITKPSSSVARLYDSCSSAGFQGDREMLSAALLFCSVPRSTS